MKQIISKILQILTYVYIWWCVVLVTVVMIGLPLFGGDLVIDINAPWK